MKKGHNMGHGGMPDWLQDYPDIGGLVVDIRAANAAGAKWVLVAYDKETHFVDYALEEAPLAEGHGSEEV